MVRSYKSFSYVKKKLVTFSLYSFTNVFWFGHQKHIWYIHDILFGFINKNILIQKKKDEKKHT